MTHMDNLTEDYHNLNLNNSTYKTEDIFKYLKSRKDKCLNYLKEWSTRDLSVTTQQVKKYILPTDNFCLIGGGGKCNDFKTILMDYSILDNYRNFYKCTGCNLLSKLTRLYQYTVKSPFTVSHGSMKGVQIEVKPQKLEYSLDRYIPETDISISRGLSVPSKTMILEPRHINIIISWILEKIMEVNSLETINSMYLTYNCGDSTLCIREKFMLIEEITLSDGDIIKTWIKDLICTIYHLNLEGFKWGYISRDSVCLNPANLRIQIRNFDMSSIGYHGLTIHPHYNVSGYKVGVKHPHGVNPTQVQFLWSTGVVNYFYLGPRYDPSQLIYMNPIYHNPINMYLVLMALGCHSNIYTLMMTQKPIFELWKNLFRPSEFPLFCGEMYSNKGTYEDLVSGLSQYHLRLDGVDMAYKMVKDW